MGNFLSMIFGGLTSAGEIISRNANYFPNSVGLRYKEKLFTWKELNSRIRRLSRAFQSHRIFKGDRVAIFAYNSNQWVESLFAAISIGAVPVTVNYRLTADEAAYIIANSKAKLLICDELTFDRSIEILNRSDELTLFTIAKNKSDFINIDDLISKSKESELMVLSKSGADVVGTQILPDDPALILYTSGTTGFPKGAVYTHKSLLVGSFIHVHAIGSRRTHRVMLPSPLYSAAGIAGIFCAMYVGSTTTIINFDVETACKTIQEESITFTNLVPTTIQMILNSAEINKYNLDSLQLLLYGGSPIPVPVLREMQSRLPDCGFRQTFATTETGCSGTVLEPAEHKLALKNPEWEHILYSCGKPQLNVDIKLVNDDWEEIEDGQPGEIAVNCEANMAGYWENPSATNQVKKNNWIRTGDLARKDKDGFYYLIDRKNDMIITGALNVYPSEVERVLELHPAIKEVAVIGVPSEKWGEEVKAIVVLNENAKLSEKEIIDYCNGKIAGYKKPKSVDFLDKLPRNPTGKIQKKLLRQKYH